MYTAHSCIMYILFLIGKNERKLYLMYKAQHAILTAETSGSKKTNSVEILILFMHEPKLPYSVMYILNTY